MGKKKDKKKGHGAEKTASKTDKKLSKKEKKSLVAKGEADIEALLAEFVEKDKQKNELQIIKCDTPSPRLNMSLSPAPERDELLMFGGEFFNGSKTFLYNDLFVYDMKKLLWSQIVCPSAPPPRCSHQAVMLPYGGGQLWVFGGEFASPSQSQFYHYKDLWVYHLKEYRWEQVKASGGPSARSGHRMVAFRKLLLVFGGFHDNLRDCRYYNDLYAFNVETRVWTKLEPSGVAPSPRSACHLLVQGDSGRVVMYGGYCKEKLKKDVERGVVHTDMYVMSLEDKKCTDSAPLKWKWQVLKQSGDAPGPRSGMASVQLSEARVLFFGGVHDREEDEESLESEFHNDSFILELEKGKWHSVILRAESEKGGSETKGALTADSQEPMEVAEEAPASHTGEVIVHDDGVFQVRIGPSKEPSGDSTSAVSETSSTLPFCPKPRMNSQLAQKHGVVYLYGGMFESQDKQVTMDDLYSLDTRHMTCWRTLYQGTYDHQVWEESDSESGESQGSEEDSEASDLDDDMDT